MSLIGPRPKNVYSQSAKDSEPFRIPALPMQCRCGATLRSQIDYLTHNCFTRGDQLGDRRTRVRL
jgi:hypothetical protein